jgi:putative intracellular protease/amidase
MRTEILLFGGYEDLDAIGPLQVLFRAGFEVALVTAGEPAAVVSASGTTVIATARVGTPDVLVVPGGGWAGRTPAGAWAEAQRGEIPALLAERARAGTTIAGVCSGAMLMARAGLLTGRPATTHHTAHADLAEAGARLVPDARVVDDGDVLTSAGVTAGLDLALWLVEREAGPAAAQAAGRWIEYRRGDVYRPGGRRGSRGEALAAAAAEGDPAELARLAPMLPGTELAAATLSHVRAAEPAYLYHHSVRSYLFAGVAAAARGLAPGDGYDDEVLFAACLLHDMGLTPEAETGQRFEVAGADLAERFLRGRGMDGERAGLVWEAIALHTSPGIADRRRPEVALARAGIAMDFGAGAEQVPDGLAATVHAAYPRLETARSLAGAIAAHAAGHPGAAPRYSMPSVLAKERSVAPFVSGLELAAEGGRWGC